MCIRDRRASPRKRASSGAPGLGGKGLPPARSGSGPRCSDNPPPSSNEDDAAELRVRPAVLGSLGPCSGLWRRPLSAAGYHNQEATSPTPSWACSKTRHQSRG
eukprot:11070980-Alexandrium_andersonii.AAC.2